MNAFMDYITKFNELNPENPIGSSEDLPRMAGMLRDYQKFKTAATVDEWHQEFNDCISAEFDESCYPVNWENVAEAEEPDTRVAFSDDDDHALLAAMGWQHLPPEFGSIEDYISSTKYTCNWCGNLVDLTHSCPRGIAW